MLQKPAILLWRLGGWYDQASFAVLQQQQKKMKTEFNLCWFTFHSIFIEYKKIVGPNLLKS